MKKNDLLLIASVALYSYLFYAQTAGVNFLIFTVCLIGLLLIKDKFLFFYKGWLATALASVLSSIAVLMYGNFITVFTNILSLSLMASFSINKNSSLILALLYSAYSYISSIAFMVISFMDKKVKEGAAKNPAGTKVLLFVIPVIVTTIFFFLYREANPIFKNFTQNIHFDFITWPWVRFTLLGLVLLYAFFNHRSILYFFNKDLEASDKLNRENSSERSNVFGKEISKENENLSGVILFGLLNLLLLLVNMLDINFLWVSGSLPDGMTYSEFVHQGVGLLIVSILVAIGIILYYFRGNLNFYEKNTTLKILAYLWILQNAILIITTASKNELYVNEYSLTYKRIGVFVYLLLSLIGLITTFIKILKIKSNWFLFRKNGWAFYVVLLISCFINWDLLITQYNIAHSKELDKRYLLSLSSSTLPDLIRISDKKDTTSPADQQSYKNWLHSKTFKFIQFKQNSNWQSWNMEDSKINQQIEELEREGKLTHLDLSNNNITSLEPLSGFKKIKELDLRNNQFEDLEQLSRFPSLEKLNLEGNRLDTILQFPQMNKLKEINISNNAIIDITFLSKAPALETLILRENDFNYLKNYPELPNLKILDLSGTPAGEYLIDQYLNLKELRLNNVAKQNLYSLPHLPALEVLELRNKYITNTDKIVFEKIAQYKTLKKLDLSNNTISDLNAIALGENTLEHLAINHNDLKNSWDIQKFPSLKYLDISYCNLTEFSPGTSLVHLSELDLTGNKIVNINPLAGMVNLKKLDLTANRIYGIDGIEQLTNLEELNLNGNTINDIRPLASLTKLRILNLDNNTVSNYSVLKKMKGLKSLTVGFLNEDLLSALAEIKGLTYLRCNGITEEQKKTLLKALPDLIIETPYESVNRDYTTVYPAEVSDVESSSY